MPSEYPRWTVLIVNVFCNISSLLFTDDFFFAYFHLTFLWFEELSMVVE